MQLTTTDVLPNTQSDTFLTHNNKEEHSYQDLIDLFNATFAKSYQTVLVKGEQEPVYLPSNSPAKPHQVVFAHGYFSSALHEIAHWCIAGEKRRMLEDYGYWYCPDGRNEEQQAKFEQVEIKPQAIEWAFSLAANKPFRVSTDNLNGAPVDQQAFLSKVRAQALEYLKQGFPVRAAQFISVLAHFYSTKALHREMFDVE